VRVAPLASLYLSQEVAKCLQQQIIAGEFLLSEPVAPLPDDRLFIPQG
jgi:L-aspartate semialdehyde sulfurtransferase